MDKIHTPDFINDLKNGILWFLLLGIMSCGVIFLLLGMFAPLPWFWLHRKIDPMLKDDLKNGHLTEQEVKIIRSIIAVIMTLWFVISWGIMIFLHSRNGGLLS